MCLTLLAILINPHKCIYPRSHIIIDNIHGAFTTLLKTQVLLSDLCVLSPFCSHDNSMG